MEDGVVVQRMMMLGWGALLRCVSSQWMSIRLPLQDMGSTDVHSFPRSAPTLFSVLLRLAVDGKMAVHN